MLNLFRRGPDLSQPAGSLYATIVEQARQPAFFRDFGVPDTVIGRFETVALHAFLVFRRLRDAGQPGRELAQVTHDLMFAEIDTGLRELGIGDMGVGKRVKNLARNLYGRIGAYEAGIDAGGAALGDALIRNLYATAEAPPRPEQVSAFAAYIAREATALQAQPDAALLAGAVCFGPVPVLTEAPVGQDDE